MITNVAVSVPCMPEKQPSTPIKNLISLDITFFFLFYFFAVVNRPCQYVRVFRSCPSNTPWQPYQNEGLSGSFHDSQPMTILGNREDRIRIFFNSLRSIDSLLQVRPVFMQSKLNMKLYVVGLQYYMYCRCMYVNEGAVGTSGLRSNLIFPIHDNMA